MKNLFILGICCALGLSASAQTATNNTSCDITIRQICVNTNPCIKNFTPNTFTVPANTAMPIPLPPCPPCNEMIYLVLWSACNTGVMLYVTPPPTVCPPAPYSSQMPACNNCTPMPATATVNPLTRDITIN